jgi:sulfofructose kinase
MLPGTTTPTSAVIVDEKGERLVASEDAQGMDMDAGWLPVERIARAGAVLSDLSWLEGTLAAFGEARAKGVPTVLDIDLGAGPLLGEVIPLTDIAIFSGPAFETFVYGASDGERLATILAAGVRHAGVTRGAGGYTWKAKGGQEGKQESFKVPVVDTTGAGDAFHGAFTLAVAQGLEDAECARVASAVAALKCRRLGARAGLPTAEELEGFLLEQTGRGMPGVLAGGTDLSQPPSR